MTSDLLRGIPRTGAMVNLAAAGAGNATAIYRISNWASQVGNKSFIPKKVMVRNNGCGNTYLHLGITAGAGVDVFPPVYVLNNMDNEWQEHDLPGMEMWGDLVAWPDAVGAGSMDVVVEVEERG